MNCSNPLQISGRKGWLNECVTQRFDSDSLQATAKVLLPGMKHARSLLDVSICVLEYFASHAAREAAGGAVSPATRDLMKEAEQARALLSAFGRLNGEDN
jgi:hypothetical protein